MHKDTARILQHYLNLIPDPPIGRLKQRETSMADEIAESRDLMRQILQCNNMDLIHELANAFVDRHITP